MTSSSKAPIQLGPIQVRFLVEAEDSGGSATVFECDVPAAANVPVAHSHDAFEETIYGLDGVTEWTVDGVVREVGPGESLCIKRGSVHGFENRSDADASFLAIATPGVFGPAYFQEIAEVAAAAAGGPPDLNAIREVMGRHGLSPAAPAAPSAHR
ncbi:MAG: cupin domain-containing protein [Solirubrobacterales bacterium]